MPALLISIAGGRFLGGRAVSLLFCYAVVTEKVKYSNKICGSTIASPNIRRFPWCPGKGYADVGRQARS